MPRFRAWRRCWPGVGGCLECLAPTVVLCSACLGRTSRPLLMLMAIVLLTSAAFQAVSPLELIYLQERFGASLMELSFAYLPMALIWALFPARMGVVIGPLAGGLLYDQVNHAAPFYFTASLTFLGALLILALIHEPEHQAAAA